LLFDLLLEFVYLLFQLLLPGLLFLLLPPRLLLLLLI
jgi:hypothetical protein